MSNDEWKTLFVLVTLMVAAFVSGALLDSIARGHEIKHYNSLTNRLLSENWIMKKELTGIKTTSKEESESCEKL